MELNVYIKRIPWVLGKINPKWSAPSIYILVKTWVFKNKDKILKASRQKKIKYLIEAKKLIRHHNFQNQHTKQGNDRAAFFKKNIHKKKCESKI